MASMMPMQGGGAGKAGAAPSVGMGAGKARNPFSGLAGQLRGQMDDVLRMQQQAEASRRQAHEQTMGRLGEVDALFEGREPFYQQVFDSVLAQGTRQAEEANRDATRQQRFGLLGRGLTGGSADVEVQSRQRRAHDDALGGVRAQARGAQRQARQGDMALRDRMRQGVMSGMPWQGAQAYRPMLPSLPDHQAAKRRYFGGLFTGLGQGGMFT